MSRDQVIEKVIKNRIQTYVTEVVVSTGELLRSVGAKIKLAAELSKPTSEC
ncbi:hypothetical protein [Apilactobacillus apinorum]|uniref:Uncharacterized protein n=1 Tax=Apilactobacillus apinorum TaxID=1218495 RepID=A0ABP9ZJ92_9LACO|nr:hypothetical protein [Apilactobacillus apinorum]CAI2694085.1 hypothetical protein AAPFHON13_13600 [Apilactobacillus apinorum]